MNSGDTVFVLMSAALVMLMTPGLLWRPTFLFLPRFHGRSWSGGTGENRPPLEQQAAPSRVSWLLLQAQGLTVSEARGFGRQRGHKEVYRGAGYQVDFVSKIKVEVVMEDDLVPEAVRIIQEKARTGQIGDGKIFILQVEDAVRIRTGETGDSAI